MFQDFNILYILNMKILMMNFKVEKITVKHLKNHLEKVSKSYSILKDFNKKTNFKVRNIYIVKIDF